jgi:hypothetical protein
MKIILTCLLLMVIPAVNNVGFARFESDKTLRDDVYTAANLGDSGLCRNAFELALKGLTRLNENGQLLNPTVVTITDLSQSSNNKRLYVIDLKNKKLLFNTYVAHGRNPGREYAKNFSNQEGSYKSSFFCTFGRISFTEIELGTFHNGKVTIFVMWEAIVGEGLDFIPTTAHIFRFIESFL